MDSPGEYRARFAAWTGWLLESGLDPQTTEPRLYRQVKVLKGLMLTAMALCIPLGLFWAQVVSPKFSYVYMSAFVAWAVLLIWLRQTNEAILVGRAAVCVLFGLCTASILLLGGSESNLLAWYMLMPLAAAVCVGRRDLWFWGVVSTLAPVVIYLFPDLIVIDASPFPTEATQQIAGIVLALGSLVVSILTGVWISHHESLADRLDDSVKRLNREAQGHRLLVNTAMLANTESELRSGAHKLLENLDQLSGVAAVCFWDARDHWPPKAPNYRRPDNATFAVTPELDESLRTGQQTVSRHSGHKQQQLYYPIRDGQNVVGAIEVHTDAQDDANHAGSWLLQQIATQLGYIAERERTAKIIRHEARYDSLTSLHNRRASHDVLENVIAEAANKGRQMALLFIDLNNFKRINDSLGHAAGDAVLQIVAKRLQNVVRLPGSQADLNVRAEDAISRIGGDEFTLLLDALDTTDAALLVAQRVLDSLALPIFIDDQQFKVGASIGIAVYPDDAQQAEVLIRAADAAMYAAKRRGRSGYSRYQDADRAVDSLGFEAEMRRALAEGELEMHYQAVFSCATGQPVGAEALIRWRHPQRGWIPPGQFIPLAENIGLMGEIGEFQFDSTLSWFSTARKRLPDDFRIALNLSPTQIEDSSFVSWLLDRLKKSEIPMAVIELEITETALLGDSQEIQASVNALAELGLCITLDDFGTGQSSLSLLKRFPIGRLKIDRSFVNGLPDRSEDVAIVGAVLSLAQSLGIPTVGEGVENDQQRQFLEARGCDDMQGFLLAKPMPGAELAQALTKSFANDGDMQHSAPFHNIPKVRLTLFEDAG